MTLDEERISFYFEIGFALVIWSTVEESLLQAATACVPESQARLLGRGYYSIENFRSKVQFADALVQERFSNSARLTQWRTVLDEVQRVSVQRNRLAHCQVAIYRDGAIGRRWCIVSNLARLDDLVIFKKRAPSNVLCLRNVIALRISFQEAADSLRDFAATLAGRPKPLAATARPQRDLPTIPQIRNQMRAKLGLPPKPSRQKY